MFKKTLLVYSERALAEHGEVIKTVKGFVLESGSECVCVGVCDLQAGVFAGVDLVITVGGDGTFIRAASYVKDILILGINSESGSSEGALTSINEGELDFVKDVFSGNYNIIERQRACVVRNGVELDKVALNDVYVGSASQFHTSRYRIFFKEKAEEQRSSGVLIATGSGSGAWYKSAGGEVFDFKEKKLKFLVRELYSGKLFKPEILEGVIEEGERIKVVSKRFDGGAIALDSDSVYKFDKGDVVEVCISEHVLRVIVK